nr:Crl family RNA polymerase assembly factor [Photobacterium kishitanii]
MTIATSFPPHGRLMSKLTAIGPYLREKNHSHNGSFLIV